MHVTPILTLLKGRPISTPDPNVLRALSMFLMTIGCSTATTSLVATSKVGAEAMPDILGKRITSKMICCRSCEWIVILFAVEGIAC